MEPVPLLEYALTVIFFVNDTENDRHPKPFRDLLTSADLEIAFAEVETHPIVDIDISLDLVTSTLARHNVSAACRLFETAQAVNRLRESKGIEYLIPDTMLEHLKRTMRSLAGHKRKYEELLEQTEREAQQKRQAKRVSATVGREERARQRDRLRVLDSQLDKKTQELATAQDLLRRQQVYTTHLKRSLECQICQEERWDTVTKCGHLFGAECIKEWLETSSTWVEDSEGDLVWQEPRCPVCRVALSEKDLKPVYV